MLRVKAAGAPGPRACVDAVLGTSVSSHVTPSRTRGSKGRQLLSPSGQERMLMEMLASPERTDSWNLESRRDRLCFRGLNGIQGPRTS